ncbi:MAG: hypothetical protein ACOYXO_15500 [Chloroflexota bacterium]
MSEAYWFASFRLETPAELPAALERSGVQPAWIEEIHWVNGSPPLDAGIFPPSAQFEWPVLSHPARLFHLLLNELVNGQRHTLLWIEKASHDRTIAAVLGSPTTVGRFNLPPEYRFLPLPQPAALGWQKMLALWQSFLEQHADPEKPLGWMSYPQDAQSEVQAVFPQAQPLVPPPSPIWTERLHAGLELSRSLSSPAGLWIDETSPHLAFLIERQ